MGSERATRSIEREQLMQAALHQGTTGAVLPQSPSLGKRIPQRPTLLDERKSIKVQV